MYIFPYKLHAVFTVRTNQTDRDGTQPSSLTMEGEKAQGALQTCSLAIGLLALKFLPCVPLAWTVELLDRDTLYFYK